MAEKKLTLEERVEALEKRLNTSAIVPKTQIDILKEELQALYVRRGVAKSSIDEKSEWNKDRKDPISEFDFVKGQILIKQEELKKLQIQIKPERVVITNENMGGM